MMIKLEDIAKLAHVSKATTSLALNDRPGVNEATRQRIKSVVSQYGYKPLRKRNDVLNFDLVAIKSANILTADFSEQPFFEKMLALFSNEASNFNVHLNTSILDMQDLRKGNYSLTGDGAFLIGTDLSEEAARLVQELQPNLVVVDTNFPVMDASFVTMDSYQGSYKSAVYLANQGFKKLGYIKSSFRMYNYDQRRLGFEDGLASVNLKLDEDNVYQLSPISTTPQPDEVSPIVNSSRLPEVFFCEDDYLALSLVKICQQHHLRIPEDIAIMGFNDNREDKLVYPEISTVHVPMREMVRQSLLTLTKLLSGELTANVKIFVSTKIVERGSTAKLD
ncbi:LacI family DNA-binding transcriptional regulator [Paucilactobacillus suebicus]|nr:LacI family DNA-binding transcriptional regulator [Paucilactobacillus suebicus]